MSDIQKFTEIVAKFLGVVARTLPDDVVAKLHELSAKETKPMAKALYGSMFDNLEAAVRLNRPACQDTGVIQFFIRAGAKFPLLSEVEAALVEATGIATKEVPLRHNAVETFTEKNTGTNLGKRAPWIEWEIVPNSDALEMDVYMAGGGCSLPGRAQVLMPSAGYETIVQFVCDTIVNLGINACPPLVVGVGVGTCVSSAAKLSKKAAMRKIGTHNDNPRAAELEVNLEKALNAIGLGPQGIGGDSTVLGVNIENAARHPSTLAVGVSVGCWAHRRGTIKINSDMSYQILSHKEATL